MTSSAVAGYNTQLYISSVPSVTMTNDTMTDSGDHQTFNEATSGHQMFDKSASFTVQAEYDEVQTVTITGGPTGGTFVLQFGGQNTSALAYNCTAGQMQTALQALSSIGSGNALVTGGPGPGTAFTVEFASALGFASQSLIVLQTNSLTGGTSPSVSITRAQGGATWTTQSGNYTINYPIGQVKFTNAFLGTSVGCRVTGKYFPFSFLGFCTTAEPTLNNTVLDVTAFTNPPSPWKTFIAGVNGGTLKLSKWWIDGTFLAHMTANDLLIIQIAPGQNANQRFQGYGVLDQDSIKSAVNAANSEELNFTIDGQLFFIAS